jgi:hypothetical protein
MYLLTDNSQYQIRLRKQYHEQAKRLLQTGGGLDPEDGTAQSDEHEQPRYKVPVTGPDSDTTPEARNLWGTLFFRNARYFE